MNEEFFFCACRLYYYRCPVGCTNTYLPSGACDEIRLSLRQAIASGCCSARRPALAGVNCTLEMVGSSSERLCSGQCPA